MKQAWSEGRRKLNYRFPNLAINTSFCWYMRKKYIILLATDIVQNIKFFSFLF
jgi:hypothetical protein